MTWYFCYQATAADHCLASARHAWVASSGNLIKTSQRQRSAWYTADGMASTSRLRCSLSDTLKYWVLDSKGNIHRRWGCTVPRIIIVVLLLASQCLALGAMPRLQLKHDTVVVKSGRRLIRTNVCFTKYLGKNIGIGHENWSKKN